MNGSYFILHSNDRRGRKRNLREIYFTVTYIRGHWSIESMHNGLDTIMMEDAMTMTDRSDALNMSIINKMILSLYKRIGELIGGKEKISKPRIRFMFTNEFETMVGEVLALLDENSLRKVLSLEKA